MPKLWHLIEKFFPFCFKIFVVSGYRQQLPFEDEAHIFFLGIQFFHRQNQNAAT